MKVIKPGDPKIARWWVGLKVKCDCCGREVELEHGDERDQHFVAATIHDLRLSCADCGTFSTYKNPTPP